MTPNDSPPAQPSDESNPPSRMLLECYLAGELSEKDAEHVRGWIDADVVRKAQADGLKGHIGAFPDRSARVDALWRQLVLRVEETSAQKPMPRHRHGWSIAAGLVIGVVGIVIGWSGWLAHPTRSVAKTVSTYTTANGERAHITLPDGNTVALNVASRLDVPADYGAGNHTVHLTGEALFTVTHHMGTPFTVIVGATAARVLGTSFTARYYSTDTTATIAVRDGKVAVGNIVVTASRLVEVGAHGGVALRSADASRFDFATGILTLDSMPLSRAVPELDRWYAADIRFGDSSLARVPIKGGFTTGSLSDLVELLEYMLNARVVKDGRVLTLYPKGK